MVTAFLRRLVPRPVRNFLRAPGMAVRLWQRGRDDAWSPRPGWTLRCPRVAIDGAFHAQQDDPPQVAEFDEFLALIKDQRNPLFFDLGCHFGLFGFGIARFCGPDARVVAVDPSPVACAMVEHIRGANGWQAQIKVLRAAVGETVGELEMIDAGPQAAGYFVLPGDQPAGDRSRVPLLTIDELCAREGRAPDLVKIDVEGYELEVLRGGRRTLEGNRVLLFIELHNDLMRQRKVDPASVLELLQAMGYTEWQCAGKPVSRPDILGQEIIRVVGRKP